MTVSPGDAAFVVERSEGLPPPLHLEVTPTSPDAAFVGVAAQPAQPPWLSLGSFQPAGTGFTLPVSLTAEAFQLPDGTHQATVRVGALRADQSVIGFRDVVVRCTVRNTLHLSSLPQDLLMVHRGARSYVASVTVGGVGYTWQARTATPWILLESPSGTTPGTFTFVADTRGMAEGSYQGHITVEETTSHQAFDVAVPLQVLPPTVVCSPDPVVLRSVVGAPLGTAEVTLSLTSGEAGTFSAEPDQGSLRVTAGGPLPGTMTISGAPSFTAPNPMSYQVGIPVCVAGGSTCGACRVQIEVTAP